MSQDLASGAARDGDRVVIVTGGSRGIGAAIAQRLADEGMAVHLTYREADTCARQVADRIGARGGRAFVHKLDIGDEVRVNEMVGEVVDRHGAVHTLVNNAGIVDDQLIALTSDASWERVLRVNLTGTFLTTRAVLPHMLDQGHGRIVNISSTSARLPAAGQAAYAASKGGVEAFTRALAAEVGRKGIRANTVAPGAISTDMTSALVQDPGLAATGLHWGAPEDVAGLVAFLVGEEGGHVNGQLISVDGGRSTARSASLRPPRPVAAGGGS
ncbi:SDR family NAD(P)-dependent oxidoreductase [Streptomyces sp. NPDC005900]|uniref:SDR family NAD(P)-dependent oxidoreductase n=1 Tax=Streptomyces sp. NPDC005900 TaxID=3154569 RepID=UPI0033E971B3